VEDLAVEDLIVQEEVVVTISHDGYIKRMAPSAYRRQQRGGKGVTGGETKEGDFIAHIFSASTHDYILMFTSLGRVYWLKVYDIPQLSRTARGRAMVNMIKLDAGETITSFVPVRDFEAGDLLMATARGKVKRTSLSAFSNPRRGGIIAINLVDEDRLIGVVHLQGGEDILLATRKGKAIRFPGGEVRTMGRNATGVAGVRLREGDQVVAAIARREAETVLTICENGYGKRTEWEAYPTKHRGGMGVVNIIPSERNGEVVRTMAVDAEDDLMVITEKGQVIRTPVGPISVIGRATQGVRLMKPSEGDRLVSATVVSGSEGPGSVA